LFHARIHSNASSGAAVLLTEGLTWFQWATEGVLILVVGILGLFGNIISIWTFSKQRVHRIFHNLLLVLAIFDIVREGKD
jgi:hypothetical protein